MWQAGALLLSLLGLLLVISAVGILPSALTDGLRNLLVSLFGMGAVVFAASVLVGGVWLLRALVRGQIYLPLHRLVGAELLFFALLALVHLPFADGRAVAESGGGGGLAGWAISQQLSGILGSVPAAALLLLAAAGGSVLAFNLDVARMSRSTLARLESMRRQASSRPEAPVAPPVAAAMPKPRERRKSTPRETGAARPEPVEGPVPTRRLRRDKRLPDINSIFRIRSKLDIDREEMNERARIIKETLGHFGIPADVVDIKPGPTVTQFGVSPGFVERRMPDGEAKKVKVKVSRIAALANDLALALSAAPIRIEAPVPGRSIVGIEVPNSRSAMVSLHSVLESDEYRKFERPLKLALGHDVAGRPIFADLAVMPHLLIAGATGSGKSVCINSMIASLLCNNTPDELRFLMIDPKMVELVNYNGLPHLLHPVLTDLDKAAGALQWAMGQMDERYRTFRAAGARNIEAYNKKTVSLDEETLPHLVVVIDELADLMMRAPEEFEKAICRLAQMARATGIHLILATQRPSVDVVTGLIKANFPARIAFAVTSQTDSRVILDTGGAEKLLGRGDMLYMSPDSSKLQRLQGCYVSDEEVRSLVAHWRRTWNEEAAGEPAIEITPIEPAAGTEKADDLLEEAIRLVRQYDRASTSFLQRRMGIGYNRAARLIDLMEARGIVGPAKEGGLAREVFLKANAGAEQAEDEE